VGATGAVGAEFFRIAGQRYSQLPKIKALASSRSVGKRLSVGGQEWVVLGWMEPAAAEPEYWKWYIGETY